MKNKNSIPRPFLKWAGGKTQIVDELLKNCPTKFENYFEPFLGGGALYFALYKISKIKSAVLSDLNRELIMTYIAIRDHVNEVLEILREYPYDREFYYELREKNPWELSMAELAARMIYLNKTCYNGLYRLNKKGKFNVPFGRYKNPKICDEDNLRAVSKALKNVELICIDFAEIIERAKKEDFVYFDPPYAPVSNTADFTSYTVDGFGWKDQIRLKEAAEYLREKGIYVMISNSAVEKIKILYKMYNIYEIEVSRFVNSKSNRRKGWKELIITSY